MADNKKKKYKKRKPSGGAPKPAAEKITQSQPDEIEPLHRQQPVKAPRPQSEKPLYMRIIMLAIAAVMILGIVISAAAGSTSGFF